METRGGVLIRVLWDRYTDATIDVKLCDSYADTYKHESMGNLLDQWDKMKKGNHSNYNNEKRKQITICYLC